MADKSYKLIGLVHKIDRLATRHLQKRLMDLPSGRYVSLCFDDFPAISAGFAADRIEARDWRATWYVCGGLEGKFDPTYGRMFGPDDLERLRQADHDIGCHTFDHIECAEASLSEMQDQISKNQIYLKSRNCPPCSSFAYPFGEANLSNKRFMTEFGIAQRGTQVGLMRDKADLSMLPAIGLQDCLGGIGTAMHYLDQLSKSQGWLVIFTHDVRKNPSPWGVTPEDFETLLSRIEASGAKVVTVGDMVTRLSKIHDLAA